MPPSDENKSQTASPVRRTAWIWLLAVGGLIATPYLALPGSWFNSGPVFNLLGFMPIVAIFVAAGINRPVRLPFILIGVGQTMFVTGDVITYNYQRFFGVPLPYPSAGDAFYLATYPFLIAGLLLMVRKRTPSHDRASLIDTLIVWIGSGTLTWSLLIAPYFHNASLSTGTKLTSIAYPVMDLGVIACAIRFTFGRGKRGVPFYLLMAGIGSLFCADSIYGWLLLHSGYNTGGVLDVGWIAFYLLMGAAAIHPDVAQLVEPVRDTQFRLTRSRMVLLAVASLATPAVLSAQSLFGTSQDVALLATCSAVTFLLVIMRMLDLVKRHDRALRRATVLAHGGKDFIQAETHTGIIEAALGTAKRIVGANRDVTFVGPDEVHSGRGLILPLRGRTESQGALVLDHVRECDADTAAALQLLANEVAMALDRKNLERQLAHQASHDELTGLANRALFRERVEHALTRAGRTGGNVAVLFLDLDDFKSVNDTAGHDAGDELLRIIGRRIAGVIRTADTAARLGGDEFAILLEDSDCAAATQIADRIIPALAAPIDIEGKNVSVTSSIGIAAPVSALEATADTLLRQADVAMYAAKDSGKCHYKLFEPEMHKVVLERLELKRALQFGLEHDEFELHYQPIVDLRTTEIVFVEALIRWQHAGREIAPGKFILLAEETGLIVPIGSWVLEHAVAQALRLTLLVGDDAPAVSVNISGRQLQRPDLVMEVATILQRTGLPPSKLVLEITETVMMSDLDFTLARLHELKALGIRLAIDDFGAGYSSLNYIRKLPVDILKIDRSFIADVSKPGEVAALTKTIMELGTILDMTPVAEGIEDPAQLEQLRQLGCPLGQGFLFMRPINASGIESAILDRSARRSAA